MKRFILSLMLGALILGGSVSASAWTETREYIWDGVASWVPSTGGGSSGGNVSVTNLASTSNGLSVSLGTQVSSVAPKGATSVGDSPWTITSSPASWTMTASATDIALWNLGATTVWLSFSGGATISAGIPLTASSTISRDAAQGMVVWAVASVSTVLHRAEGRR